LKRNVWNTGWWRSPARPPYDKAFIPLGEQKKQLNDSIRRKQAAKQLSEGAKVKKALM
jgi:hypothetical protein